jgi:hypothetical protein
VQENPNYFTTFRITQDDGLLQGSNYFRYEDSKGFMWITGNDALNKHDGSSAKVYNLQEFFKDCPTLQQGYGFAEDENNFYVDSTRDLYIYDYKTNTFSLIQIFKNPAKKLLCLLVCREAKIWCLNENYELASFAVKTKTVKIEAKIPLNPLKSVHIYNSED